MVTRRADRVRCFVEDPAGLAAVSLRLHGGPNCRPPISRMGSKTGYAQTILAALGLQSGQGAGAYLWVEADRDVAALLRCYPDAEMLRRIAEIIRGWADEEPRALWERLRAERKARGPESALQTAEWIVVQGVQFGSYPLWTGATGGYESPAGVLSMHPNRLPELGGRWPETAADACHRLAESAGAVSGWLIEGMWSYRQGDLTSGGPVLPGERRQDTTAAAAAAAACKKLANAADIARVVEGMAREVAEHAFLHQGSFQYKGPDAGIGRPEGMEAHDTHGGVRPVTAILSDSFPRLSRGWPPVVVTRRIPEPAEVAEWLGTPGDLSGVVRYADPPYLGTTGYADDYPRAEVVRLALAYAAMGATVCVSEATPIPELVEAGWEVCEITGGRVGQKRTFSAQKREFLTMNRAPAHRVAEQVGMFGGAA